MCVIFDVAHNMNNRQLCQCDVLTPLWGQQSNVDVHSTLYERNRVYVIIILHHSNGLIEHDRFEEIWLHVEFINIYVGTTLLFGCWWAPCRMTLVHATFANHQHHKHESRPMIGFSCSNSVTWYRYQFGLLDHAMDFLHDNTIETIIILHVGHTSTCSTDQWLKLCLQSPWPYNNL